MHFSVILPAVIDGAKARRRQWGGTQYIYVDGPYSDGKSVRRCSGGSYGTWPVDGRDSEDLLADDWELVPKNVSEFHSYIRGDAAAAVDVVTAEMRASPPRSVEDWKVGARDSFKSATLAMEMTVAQADPKAVYFVLRSAAVSAVLALADFISENEEGLRSLREPKGEDKTAYTRFSEEELRSLRNPKG